MTTNHVARAESSIVEVLGSAFAPSDDHLENLVTAFASRSDGAGLLDIAYQIVDSPYGPLLVAATAEGVVRVAFANEDHDVVLAELARTVSPRILEFPDRTAETARQLGEYFEGRRQTFEVPVDLRLVHGFRRQVISHLSSIPYGTTASYAELAATVGNPRAVRAVGSACAHNPVPVLVPCHRVVRSDGSIGNYLGGTEAKRSLLRLEAA
ncbi:MAG: methylated-DNA--[protein]-cysteine S-methyltransferase [Microthrixaceae bacterium]